MNKNADADPAVMRLSLDTKNKVAIGPYSRGGVNRVKKEAADHDFGGEELVPYGILAPQTGNVHLYFSSSKATADFMVDCLDDYWEQNKSSYPLVTKLVLNQDNGPENNSHRTHFINRIVDFSMRHNLEIQLAYYPPYHSKYNPVERVWGVLEQHWNGDILESRETVLKFAQTMTWKKNSPTVKLVEKPYYSGVKLTKKEMSVYESAIERCPTLEKWFVRISPARCRQVLAPACASI